MIRKISTLIICFVVCFSCKNDDEPSVEPDIKQPSFRLVKTISKPLFLLPGYSGYGFQKSLRTYEYDGDLLKNVLIYNDTIVNRYELIDSFAYTYSGDTTTCISYYAGISTVPQRKSVTIEHPDGLFEKLSYSYEGLNDRLLGKYVEKYMDDNIVYEKHFSFKEELNDYELSSKDTFIYEINKLKELHRYSTDDDNQLYLSSRSMYNYENGFLVDHVTTNWESKNVINGYEKFEYNYAGSRVESIQKYYKSKENDEWIQCSLEYELLFDEFKNIKELRSHGMIISYYYEQTDGEKQENIPLLHVEIPPAIFK